MKLYMLMLLVTSACGKVVLRNENGISNEITKDEAEAKITQSKVSNLPTETPVHVKNPLDNNIEGNDKLAEEKDDTKAKITPSKVTDVPTDAPVKDKIPLENNIEGDDKLANENLVTSTTAATQTKPIRRTFANQLDINFLSIINNGNYERRSAPRDFPKTQLPEPTTSEAPVPKVDNGIALHLTPLIKEGRIEEARNASSVDPTLFLGFESYSGFLTVDEELKSHLFFWYFPVPKKPVNETPWVVWLQGGPGASSMMGLFEEIGPINVSPFGTLRKNQYSWIQNHSLLFIDNPVGAGFSYTESGDGFTKDMETYATHLHKAMKQFITIFPELQAAPLFIAGESYAGKYVPALAMKIHRHRDQSPHFNLQGVMLGNALVDPEVISHIAEPFQYFGLIDETQLHIIQPLVDAFRADIANNKSVEAKSKWVSLIASLIYLSHQRHAYNFLVDDLNIGKYLTYLAKSEVKRALHVGDIVFSSVNVTVNMELAPDFLSNTRPMMEELLDHYRVLLYCGQLDQMLPCLHTSKNYRTWKWNGTEEFLQAVRYPYLFKGRNAGYEKTGGGLSEVMFRGAGHMVPHDAPAPAQALVTLFTHARPLVPRNLLYEEATRNMHTYLTTYYNVTMDF